MMKEMGPEQVRDALIAYRSDLQTYFARRLNPHEDVEDLIHEVYLRMLAPRDFMSEPIRDMRGFAFRVARNVLIDKMRRDHVRCRGCHDSFDEEMTGPGIQRANCPEATTSARQQLRSVGAILMQLDPVCREAFMMARIEGHDHKAVARHLGIVTSEVGRHVQRALVALSRLAA